jgi:hypothetical protein
MNRLLSCSLALLALTAGCDAGKPPTGGTTIVPSARPAAAKPKKPAVPAETFGYFGAVAKGERITIYPMGDHAIIDTGAFLAVVGDGPLEQDATLFRSSLEKEPGKVVITSAAPLTRFFGAYPTQAWAEGEGGGFMKLVKDLWVKQEVLREGEKLLSATPWEKGRMIAAIRMAKPDIRFTLIGSAAGGVVPAPGKPTAAQKDCAVRMDPDAPMKVAGTTTGHLFAIGKECKTGKLVAERWAPGKVRGDVDVLEGVAGTPVAVAAAGPDEAYAVFADGDKGHLAIWDGKAWKGEKGPFGTPTSLFMAHDSVWALGAAGLFQRPKGGAWEEISVGAHKPTSAWAKDSNTVWIVADHNTLVRSGRRARKILSLPPMREVKTSVERDKHWPATDACKQTYVQLATMGPAADKVPASFPALNEAVKGKAELTARQIEYVIEEVGGNWIVGAKVPSVAVADKLVAAYRAKQQASKPLVFCHAPMVVKGTLKIE